VLQKIKSSASYKSLTATGLQKLESEHKPQKLEGGHCCKSIRAALVKQKLDCSKGFKSLRAARVTKA
jgi:hypothetical protein